MAELPRAAAVVIAASLCLALAVLHGGAGGGGLPVGGAPALLQSNSMGRRWAAVNHVPDTEAERVKERAALEAFRKEHEGAGGGGAGGGGAALADNKTVRIRFGNSGNPDHPFNGGATVEVTTPSREPQLPQSALQGWSDLLSRVTRELASDTYVIQTMKVNMKALEHQNAVLLAKYAGIANMKDRRGPPGAQGVPGPEGRPGIEGPPGPRASKGSPGPEGAPGRPGSNGKPGKPGAPGEEGVEGPRGRPGKGVSMTVVADSKEAPRALGLAEQDNSDERSLEVRVAQMAQHMRELTAALTKLQTANARLRARRADARADGAAPEGQLAQPTEYMPLLQRQQPQQPAPYYYSAYPTPLPAAAATAPAPAGRGSRGRDMRVLTAAHPNLGVPTGGSLMRAKARLDQLSESPAQEARELERATGGGEGLLSPLPEGQPQWIKTLDKWEAKQKKRGAARASVPPAQPSSWLGGLFGDASAQAPGRHSKVAPAGSWW